MLVGIHQPHYLGWLRYFDKIARCDAFILLDDVDFTRNGWQNRNRIKTAQGPLVLTVPVRHKLGQPINEVAIDAAPWARKHWAAISQSYVAAPFFKEYQTDLAAFYGRDWTLLGELAQAQIEWQLKALKVQVPVVLSSSIKVEGSSSQRLVNLIQALGGTGYLSGAFALSQYLDPQAFRNAGLELWTVDWSCPTYPQIHSKLGFAPDLAAYDLLFNVGSDEALKVLRSGSRVERYVN